MVIFDHFSRSKAPKNWKFFKNFQFLKIFKNFQFENFQNWKFWKSWPSQEKSSWDFQIFKNLKIFENTPLSLQRSEVFSENFRKFSFENFLKVLRNFRKQTEKISENFQFSETENFLKTLIQKAQKSRFSRFLEILKIFRNFLKISENF